VIFTPPPEPIDRVEAVSVSPHRLLALLDKARDYPLLKAYHPESVMQVEYRNYSKEPRVMDYHDYEIQLDEVFRFDPETRWFSTSAFATKPISRWLMRRMDSRCGRVSGLISHPSATRAGSYRPKVKCPPISLSPAHPMAGETTCR